MSTQLQEGTKAPDFHLASADGGTISLHDYLGKRVIVYFYPAAGTPGCTKEACDFRDSLSSLTAAGYAVIGISPDSPDKLARFVKSKELTFALASDPDKQTLTAYGAYGEKSLYGKRVEGVIRSTFVIAPDGAIEHALYNVKATGHVARLRRLIGLDDN